MLKSYFTIAWRNLLRNKVYSALNIVGLAIGISACILISLFVQDELSYDKHFDKSERIFKIANVVNLQGQIDRFGLTAISLAPHLQREFPELEAVTRVMPVPKQTVWYEDKTFNEENLYFSDSAFFRIFSHQFIAGDAQNALKEPKTIIITEELANKYFGSADAAIGKVLKFTKNPHKVTGVVENPQHSHLKFSGLLSVSTFPKEQLEQMEKHWLNLSVFTYVLLRDPKEAPAFLSKLQAFGDRVITPWLKEEKLNATITFHLQQLPDLHLSTDFMYEPSPAGNRAYIYVFGFVALFILGIACINYMNLATARSAKRAKEVGLRKVVGAYRGQLIGQFVGESVLMTLLAVVLAVALVELMLPTFNELTEKAFTHTYFMSGTFVLTLLGIVLLVGLLGGSYPAFFLSNFKPVDVLKSDKSPSGSSAMLRKALVVTQFTISLIMIIGTIVVFSQMHYLKNTNLGFNKEQVLVIDVPGGDTTLTNSLPSLQNELLQNPQVKQVATSANIPGEESGRLLFLVHNEGKKEEKALNVMYTGYGFLDLMGMKISEGRDFSKDMAKDEDESIIINEAAAKWLGWTDPIGKKMTIGGNKKDVTVIGVVRDFHYTSLHSKIEPLVMVLAPKYAGFMQVRLSPENLPAMLSFIEQKWKTFDPKHPMEYYFLDENFDKQYRAEEKMLTVFGYFAGLTILIACLGLFGLASFTAEQRTKEIGIRKVMGSSVSDIILLLSRDFAVLVLIAIVVASPIAWYGMHKWLEDFAYRTDIGWWVFLAAGVSAMAIAMLTVSYQATRAALLNPVRALRSE